MKITFLGHASFSVEVNGKHLVVDPFISGNPMASAIAINEIKADYILVTHAHQDHVLDVELIAKNTNAIIVSNFEIASYYQEKGFNVFPMNHGGTFKTDNFSAKYVNAIHTSSFADGTYGGQPGGFVVSSSNKSVYFSGDSALTFDMKLIPLFTKLDAAIFPIGDTFTMGISDAIIASDFVECDTIIGCHFDTFPPIKIDKEKAIQQFSGKHKKLILLEIGKHITL
jgi:L-ascorbate metabolism protein UlaG (beta-lactamase superfamily)